MTLCGFEIAPGEKRQVNCLFPAVHRWKHGCSAGRTPERRWWSQLGCMAANMSAFWLCKN